MIIGFVLEKTLSKPFNYIAKIHKYSLDPLIKSQGYFETFRNHIGADFAIWKMKRKKK